ncbi:hypothetical protein JYK02_05765 [Corallococcus macrosporus]|uniref:Lipoprotein n=1 Tax=Corallococcus macrosporus TaxID=35 RepID=A0ABS3D5S0_9BACT|nr:hypothetical protein [Corallococcus macrosporus]MBN8227015.1 hypothetical protein [Corallococcus macrosporus]
MKVVAKLLSVSAIAFLIAACGGGIPEDGEMDGQNTPAVESPASSENLGQTEQEVSCGWGGPPAHCLVRCCSHADWSDIGVPAAGACTEAGNSYCAARGGNCGSCWGYL